MPETFDPVTENGASMGTSLAGDGDLVIAGAPITGLSVTLQPDQPIRSGRLYVFGPGLIFSDRFESNGTLRVE